MNAKAVPIQDQRIQLSFEVHGVPVRELLALRFHTKHKEDEFIRYYLPISLFQSRVAICMSAILIIGDYIADSLFYGLRAAPGNILRITLFPFALLIIFLLSYIH